MKYSLIILNGFLVLLLADFAFALRCYNCYIDGPKSFNLFQPNGPVWQKCTGNDEDQDFKTCEFDEDICIEIKLYGEDPEEYQILRSCAYGPEVCDNLEIRPDIYIEDCKTCTTDACNDILQ